MDNVVGWLIVLGCLAAFRLISDAVYGAILLIYDKVYPRTAVTLSFRDASGKLVKKKFDKRQLNSFVEKYAPDSVDKEKK